MSKKQADRTKKLCSRTSNCIHNINLCNKLTNKNVNSIRGFLCVFDVWAFVLPAAILLVFFVEISIRKEVDRK